MMRTRLECNIQGTALSIFSSLAQYIDFGVGASIFLVVTFCDDCSVLDKDRSDERIRACPSAPFFGQCQSSLHILNIIDTHSNTPKVDSQGGTHEDMKIWYGVRTGQ